MTNNSKLVLAMDQGTTSSRAILFDGGSETVAVSQREFRQIFPQSGWVEHDPQEILDSQIGTAEEVLEKAGAAASDIAAIGITNQRETTILWDRSTGKPVSNAIVWQDRRTALICEDVRAEHGEMVTSATGLEVDPYFSASKVRWMLENLPGVRERAEAGEIAFGTVDSWLIWNLTGGQVHVTDVSNASRTMLFNIHMLEWDEELLAIFGVPSAVLPEVIPSSGFAGEVALPGALAGIPITGIAGDQQAALFGQRCFAKGGAKSTYGTGCFLLQNTGTRPAVSENRLLSTVAWGLGGETFYALEGSVFIGGAVIQWLRDSLGIISSAGEVQELADSVASSEGVFFVPAFAGLGTPYWDPAARGLIVGLTRGTGKAHLARAALESIAFQTAELLEAMQKDSHEELTELRVDGGASSNDLLMQIQADLLQIPVVRSTVTETTALGAAYLAGIAEGVWSGTEAISRQERSDRRFEPSIDEDEAGSMMLKWKEAVKRSLDWAR
jgi:glycerol kinase